MSERWPEPTSEQTEVMLLGCYHMDNPGLDVVNVEADDVLTERRQRELASLADRLTEWNPDGVAVERPAAAADAVNDLYREYADGDRDFNEAADVESSQPGHDVEARSEVVQIGFRIAARQGHDRVHPIDDHVDPESRFDEETLSQFGGADIFRAPPERRERYDLADPEVAEERLSRRLRESTISEYLAWQNREENLIGNHRRMFAAALPRGETDPPLGPAALGIWFERNLRMAHHLWRVAERGNDRVLLVVGSGHVRVLRYLLDETPMTCPTSPLPYLP